MDLIESYREELQLLRRPWTRVWVAPLLVALIALLICAAALAPDQKHELELVAGIAAIACATAWALGEPMELLLPWLALLTFRDIVLSFQWTFTPSFVMTGGDPYYATMFLPLLTYEEAFDRFRFGAGSALMLLTFLLSVAIIGAIYLFFRRRGYVADV